VCWGSGGSGCDGGGGGFGVGYIGVYSWRLGIDSFVDRVLELMAGAEKSIKGASSNDMVSDTLGRFGSSDV
jgi:hypothetical protein